MSLLLKALQKAAQNRESASPATGLHKLHVIEQAALVEQALVG